MSYGLNIEMHKQVSREESRRGGGEAAGSTVTAPSLQHRGARHSSEQGSGLQRG